jgi:hypothetical protein
MAGRKRKILGGTKMHNKILLSKNCASHKEIAHVMLFTYFKNNPSGF